MAMVYRWASRIPGNAQACGEELDRIQSSNDGQLETKAVLQAARSRKNPLHECFEWKDNVAAEHYREYQARMVINSIRVVSIGESGGEELVRCFVNLADPATNQRRYVAVAKLADDADLFEQARRQFLQDLQVFEKRYHSITQIREMVARVRELVDTMAVRGAEAPVQVQVAR